MYTENAMIIFNCETFVYNIVQIKVTLESLSYRNEVN